MHPPMKKQVWLLLLITIATLGTGWAHSHQNSLTPRFPAPKMVVTWIFLYSYGKLGLYYKGDFWWTGRMWFPTIMAGTISEGQS